MPPKNSSFTIQIWRKCMNKICHSIAYKWKKNVSQCILHMYSLLNKNKLSVLSRRCPEGSLFNSLTLKRRGGRYTVHVIAPLYPYIIVLSAKESGIKYYFFESLVWLNLRFNPSFPRHWLTLYPLGQWPDLWVLLESFMCVSLYICVSNFQSCVQVLNYYKLWVKSIIV